MLIKKKLPLISTIIISATLLLMSTFYYIYFSDTLIENNQDAIHNVLDVESSYLDLFFRVRGHEIDLLSRHHLVVDVLSTHYDNPLSSPLLTEKNLNMLNTYFESIKATRQDVSDVYILNHNGIILSSSEPNNYGIDLSDREYFLDAMQGKATLSNLLKDRVNGNSVLFLAAPVYNHNHNEVVGVIANIIDTEAVSKTMRNIIDSSIGNAYLINTEGSIVLHTNSALVGNIHDDFEINAFFQTSDLSQSNEKYFNRNALSYYVAYKSVPNTPWILVIEQDMSLITKSADRVLLIMLFIGSIALIISNFISVKFIKTLTDPLTELSKVMHETAHGDLSMRSQYVSENELGHLSEDLNHMLDELTGAYEEVDSKNQLLQATDEELRQNNIQLERSWKAIDNIQQKYKLALEGSSDVIWEWTHENNHFFASEVWEKVTGLSHYNPKIETVVFETLVDAATKQYLYDTFNSHLKSNSETFSIQFSILSTKGKKIHLVAKGQTLRDPLNEPIKTSGVLADITFEKETNDKIERLAFTHQLTELPNRTAYITRLKEVFATPYIDYDHLKKLAVFQMDIDNFMRINDALGHEFGDLLLAELAKRLKTIENQFIELYHLSADEFAFIVHVNTGYEAITNIAENIHALLNAPFLINDKLIHLGMSTGISVYPDDAKSAIKLIQNADTAMFEAKNSGKGSFVFYTEFLSESVSSKVEIESILRKAISEELIELHYQPQYEPLEERLLSFEGLMRIHDGENNYISPGDFIPIAEENGMIIQLGEWAIIDACHFIQTLKDKNVDFQHISVNVSVEQLNNDHFLRFVKETTAKYNVHPEELEFEVTESILLDSSGKNTKLLEELRTLGFKIALDDFGTGYSSFSHLKTLPLTTLKIDKSFVDDLTTSRKDRELVRQMIDFSHELKLKVVAEGVESKNQLDILKNTTCDLIQGYYFSKPLPKDQAIKLATK